ncbi:MAG: hypothetical protein KAR38_15780 [Calditrichia bacterium]|nr:hypothetical protein [Calditrichia bacterium]
MKKILTGLLIGTIAGIIDVIPMIIQGLNWYANISAFSHWVVLGVIIPFVNWNIKAWLKGLIIGEITAIPIMIIVLKDDPASIIPIFIFSTILGILVGISGQKFVKN